MKTQGYDLRALIIKSDLEGALLEKYQIKRDILSLEENQFFLKYQEDSADIFDYVRELLLNSDNKCESENLFTKIQKQITQLYPEDNELHKCISELGDSFISSIEQGVGNYENIFYSKARILK